MTWMFFRPLVCRLRAFYLLRRCWDTSKVFLRHHRFIYLLNYFFWCHCIFWSRFTTPSFIMIPWCLDGLRFVWGEHCPALKPLQRSWLIIYTQGLSSLVGTTGLDVKVWLAVVWCQDSFSSTCQSLIYTRPYVFVLFQLLWCKELWNGSMYAMAMASSTGRWERLEPF